MIHPADRARLYHAQYHDFAEDIPFWLALAGQSGGPILEMGCGTGRLLHALSTTGHNVIGVDHDPAMVDFARRCLGPSVGQSISLVEGDLARVSLEKPVQLAIGALNTFAYLDDQNLESVLSNISNALNRGGLIALDLPTLDQGLDAMSEDAASLDDFVEPALGSSIEVRAKVLSHDGKRVDIQWLYDELHPDGTVQRHIWEQTYYLRSLETLKDPIEKCNLSLRSVYGDYDFSPLRADSNRLLLVLEK